ncbi:hypothetical protein EYF80_061832 [Liparis tanakae]|uniref:Uncharacterized protein n=1 Tax=Liparis tanakae TaxID=230148 RepID=A0A4Z2EH72_9TELE|nr:hypothetical protein EYF80_061832 [Liparis tanakae]
MRHWKRYCQNSGNHGLRVLELSLSFGKYSSKEATSSDCSFTPPRCSRQGRIKASPHSTDSHESGENSQLGVKRLNLPKTLWGSKRKTYLAKGSREANSPFGSGWHAMKKLTMAVRCGRMSGTWPSASQHHTSLQPDTPSARSLRPVTSTHRRTSQSGEMMEKV